MISFNDFYRKYLSVESKKPTVNTPFYSRQQWIYFSLALLCVVIVGNWFLFHYETQEVVWETHGFWIRYNLIFQWLVSNPLMAIQRTVQTIQTQDYNYLSIWPLLPFRFFSESRTVFFLSILNSLAIPAAAMCIAAFAWFRASFSSTRNTWLTFAIPAAVLVFNPAFWMPITVGYLDVGLMFFACACFILWFRRPMSEQSLLSLLSMGLLFAVGLFFRRYFVIWSIAFCCMVGVDVLTQLSVPFRDRIKGLVKIIAVGMVFMLAIILIAWPLVQHMISYDYTDAYSVYKKQDTLPLMLLDFYKYFGLFYTFVFIAGIITAIGRPSSMRVSSLLLFQAVITFVIFHSFLDFAPYQYYLLLPTIVIFSSEFFLFLLERYRNMTGVILLGFCITTILFFGGVFFPSMNNMVAPIRSFFAIRKNYPQVRTDIPEMTRLVDTLNELVANTDDTIYVLADSNTLQDRTLLYASYALNKPVPSEKNVVGTASVDKRDGFSKFFFDATYVVVGSPVWHTLNSVDQRILMLPAQAILKGEGIGKAYERLPYQFMLERKTRVYIYKRTKLFQRKDLDALSKELEKTYPDRPKIFTLPIRDELIQL